MGRGSRLLSSGLFFRGVWKLVRKLLSKDTQKKISIESGSGLKTIKKFISDDARMPAFLGGACAQSLLSSPGVASKDLRAALSSLDVTLKRTHELKRFFWDVDMSRPGNWLGVEPCPVQSSDQAKPRSGQGHRGEAQAKTTRTLRNQVKIDTPRFPRVQPRPT